MLFEPTTVKNLRVVLHQNSKDSKQRNNGGFDFGLRSYALFEPVADRPNIDWL